MLASIKGVKILALAHVVLMLNVESKTMFQSVLASLDTKVIHSLAADQFLCRLKDPFLEILAIHLLAEQTHNATMASAHACPSTKVILTAAVGQSASSTMTAPATRLAWETNALIPVQELVEIMLAVKSSTTSRHAHVHQEWKETLSHAAHQNRKSRKSRKIHAIHHLAEPTLNVEMSTVMLFVRAFPNILVRHPTADLNVF
jgi:hypothetical protein